MITAKKLLRVLEDVDALQGLGNVSVRSTYGGEVAISFRSQPARDVDSYLQHKGFVFDSTGGDYNYRPR